MNKALPYIVTAAYLAAGSLTFGVVWNENNSACVADQKINEWRYCDGPSAGMGAIVAGLFWPVTWPARFGVELTRGVQP